MQAHDILQQLTNLNKQFLESFKQLTDINTTMMRQLTDRQLSAAQAYVDSLSKHIESTGDIKNTQQLMALQAKLASELSEKMLDNARQTLDILTHTRSELAAWVNKGMDVATQTVSSQKD